MPDLPYKGFPYDPSFSFSGWSITHPGEPHQGDKLDEQFGRLSAVTAWTQIRLDKIMTDDDYIKPTAIQAGIGEIAQQFADQAANRTYADNLASVADKALARDNLQLPQHYPQLNGNNLVFMTSTTELPSFPPPRQGIPTQTGSHEVGIFPTSSAAARQFRASVLFGTLYDYPTETSSPGPAVPYPPAVDRVDNVAMALLWGGTLGQNLITGGGGQEWIPGGLFQVDYRELQFMPSVANPFVTLRQLCNAVENKMTEHLNASNTQHLRIPTINQKAALDAATTASATNRFATLAEVQASGNFTAGQINGIYAGESPSSSNPFVTESALTTVLTTGYSPSGHTHDASEIDFFGTDLSSVLLAAKPVHSNVGGQDYLTFTADNGFQYKVAATPV